MRHIISIQKKATIREGSFKQYIADVSKYKVLSNDELTALCEVIKNGEPHEVRQAQDKLIQSNLRFVVSVAKQYVINEEDFPDLINEGNYGLIIAARKYDKSKDVKFSYFAVFWIRKYILEFISYNKHITLPQNRVTNIKKIKEFVNLFEIDYGYLPSAETIMDHLDVTEKDIVLYETESNYKPTSLSKPIDSADGMDSKEISNIIESDYFNYAEEKHETDSINYQVETLLNGLKPKDAEIIKHIFGIGFERPFGIDEVAKIFNLSGERIRQIREKALKSMRDKLVVL